LRALGANGAPADAHARECVPDPRGHVQRYPVQSCRGAQRASGHAHRLDAASHGLGGTGCDDSRHGACQRANQRRRRCDCSAPGCRQVPTLASGTHARAIRRRAAATRRTPQRAAVVRNAVGGIPRRRPTSPAGEPRRGRGGRNAPRSEAPAHVREGVRGHPAHG